jgi:hypothetical protein
MRYKAEAEKGLYLDGLVIVFPGQIAKVETLLIIVDFQEAWQSGERPIMPQLY